MRITTLFLLLSCYVLQGQISTQGGNSFVIDTVFVDKNPICSDDTVTFYFKWPYDEYVEFDWRTRFPINRLDGAVEDDTFLIAVMPVDTFDMTVTPKHVDGLPTDFRGSIIIPQAYEIGAELCSGDCFQIGDSCYTEQEPTLINTGLISSKGCDSIVILDLTFFNVLPSPTINCQPTPNGILVDWEMPSKATEYEVFIDRDSFTTVSDNFLHLEGFPDGTFLNIKIQPKGYCTYLPGETSCVIGISAINDDFLNHKIYVFPNPTTGNLNIETDLKIESVEVFDATGRLLQKEKSSSFELKKRDAGIYILKIKTNEGVGIKRILIN